MNMNDPSGQPYARDRMVDKPGIMGARWWHASLADGDAQVARRTAIRNILIAGGVIAGFGAMLAMCVGVASSGSSSGSGTTTAPGTTPLPADMSDSRKTSLEMQKEYGWAFGAVSEPLVFDGVTTKPFQPGALQALSTDLAPTSPALKPFFQSTLFDSPSSVPKSLGKLDPDEAAAGFKPLSTEVKPISTAGMDAAYARGRSMASIFASLVEGGGAPSSAKTALVVDLPGHEAVAFAAGASAAFDPVFLFDNWPHPRGVVRAQETLSAAAYFQPLFAEVKRKPKPNRAPMFVLDRRRIAAYTDDATQFDNRYVAKLPPSAAAMRALGVNHVLYVVPTKADAATELDDLNDEFVVYNTGGVDVKTVSLDMFSPDSASSPDAGGPDPRPPGVSGTPPANGAESDGLLRESGYVYYGGTRGSHHSFFTDYPWARPARPASTRPSVNPGKAFTPVARSTTFSSGSPSTTVTTKTRPSTFGTVPVVVAVGTGVILGSRYSRSGSWNRSSGGFGG